MITPDDYRELLKELTPNQIILLRHYAGERMPKSRRYHLRRAYGNVVANEQKTREALRSRGLLNGFEVTESGKAFLAAFHAP